MKKIKEQIDYGNNPERMDPELERKLGDPEGLYGNNPGLNGPRDVERLVSNRFQKVTEKLRQVTGIADLSSQRVQVMVYQEMLAKLPGIMATESRHRDELEQIAIEASLNVTEVPPDWFKIEASLNREPIETDDFRFSPEDNENNDEENNDEENNQGGENNLQFPDFDIDKLSPDEEFILEKHKRNIINAIIQGSSKKGHYIFQDPEIKAKLDNIDPNLYNGYLGIMAINDFLYFTMEQMIEVASQTGQGVGGRVKIEDDDSQDGEGGEGGEGGEDDDSQDGEGGEGGEGGEDDESPTTIIKASGLIFPILCHEIIKGIEEARGRHGLPKNAELSQKVMGQTDIMPNEPMQLRIGPELVDKIRTLLPDEMFEPENKGLVNWFYQVLYEITAKDFLKIILYIVSEDPRKNALVARKLKEVMNEAITLKTEYENTNNDDNVGDNDDEPDDDDTDDLFKRLGITRPGRN